MKTRVLVALTVSILGGCASVQLSKQKLQQSDAMLRAAEESGAQIVPLAKLRLETARAERDAAERLEKKGDQRALIVLDQSITNARLAQALAQVAVSAALIRSATQGLTVPDGPMEEPEEQR